MVRVLTISLRFQSPEIVKRNTLGFQHCENRREWLARQASSRALKRSAFLSVGVYIAHTGSGSLHRVVLCDRAGNKGSHFSRYGAEPVIQ